MKYLGAGLVWIGVAGAVAAIAFGTHDVVAVVVGGMVMASFAMLTLMSIANS